MSHPHIEPEAVMPMLLLLTACAPLLPTGPRAVGTHTWLATHDADVDDVLAEEPGATRKVPVGAWFPVDGEAGAVTEDATWTDAESPVLVFVHGTGGELEANAYLYEELASRGWVVLAAAHPGLARVVTYPDDPKRKMSDELAALVADRNFDDPLVTESIALFRADVRLELASALDELPGLALDRVVYGGHSMGAAVAVGVCREADAGCVGFVNLDGPPLADLGDDGEIEPEAVPVPMIVVTAELTRNSEDTADLWAELDAQAELGDAPMLQVELQDAGHLDLTDASLDMGQAIVRLLYGKTAAGSIDAGRAVEVTRGVVATFLERFGACDASVIVTAADWPELEVVAERGLEELPGCERR